jgi:hypothetical protein
MSQPAAHDLKLILLLDYKRLLPEYDIGSAGL